MAFSLVTLWNAPPITWECLRVSSFTKISEVSVSQVVRLPLHSDPLYPWSSNAPYLQKNDIFSHLYAYVIDNGICLLKMKHHGICNMWKGVLPMLF